jgi:carbonic anhydrase
VQKLVQGVHSFQREYFSSNRELFEQLALHGQRPETLFIACSDSRVDATLITQSRPGELFELQNAGNLVPPYGAGGISAEAAIEYALVALKVKHIVVCGHSHCGAMSGLLDPDSLKGMPAVATWLKNAETTRRIIQENYTHLTDPAARLTATVEENVLVQLEHLRTHPAVAVALSRKALHLHGWVYKFETGEVFFFDPEREQFMPLNESPAATQRPSS